MTETWIPSDAPDAVKRDVCPPGYQVLHRHRGTSGDQRGGGEELVHRDVIHRDWVASRQAHWSPLQGYSGRLRLQAAWNRHVDFHRSAVQHAGPEHAAGQQICRRRRL